MLRWDSRASVAIFRYRGSKTCSGRLMCGKRTTFGSGNSGSRSGRGCDAASPITKLRPDDLDGEIAVAGAVELGGDDRLELPEDELALRDLEGQRMAEQRRLQVRVRVLPVAVGELRVVVFPP